MTDSFLMHIIDELRKYLNMNIDKIKSVKGGLEIYKATLIEYTKTIFNELRNEVVKKLQDEPIEQTVDKLRKIINKTEEIIHELKH